MSNRRHHEVSPGGDHQTHREHYDKDARQIDRRERREERRQAREHFRNKRDKIREEIDMCNASLTRKLHVKMAEAEMLRVQMDEEKLDYRLPDNYAEIQLRIAKLGDGEDQGAYEADDATKQEQRRTMRNDLQILRLTVRGLRTSLRRHVNHVQEPVVVTVPVETPPTPPVAPAPESKPRMEDGAGEGSGDSKPAEEEEEKGSDEPDPAPTVVPVPTPVEGDGPRAEEGPEDRGVVIVDAPIDQGQQGVQDGAQTGNGDTPPVLNDRAAQIQEDPVAKEKAVGELKEKLRPLQEGNKTKFDDDFVKWFGENYPTTAIIKAKEEVNKTDQPTLNEAWEGYIKNLIESTKLIIQSQNLENENVLDPYTDDFFRHLRDKDERTFVKDLQTLIGGNPDQVEGVLTYLDIDSSVFQNAQSQVDQYLPNISEVLIQKHGVEENTLNEKTDRFWESFRKEDPVRMSQLLKRMTEGQGNEDAVAAFNEAQTLYISWAEKNEKENPPVSENTPEGTPQQSNATETATEATEAAPTLLELAQSSRNLNVTEKDGGFEVTHKNPYGTEIVTLNISENAGAYTVHLPKEFHSMVGGRESFTYSNAEDLLKNTEALLNQMDYMSTWVKSDKAYEDFKETPYTVSGNMIHFHEAGWIWGENVRKFSWKSPRVSPELTTQCFISADTTAKTLNELYFKKNPSYAPNAEAEVPVEAEVEEVETSDEEGVNERP